MYQIGAYSSSSSNNSKNASATILNCESSDFSPPLRGRAFTSNGHGTMPLPSRSLSSLRCGDKVGGWGPRVCNFNTQNVVASEQSLFCSRELKIELPSVRDVHAKRPENFRTTTLVLRHLVLKAHRETQRASVTLEARAGTREREVVPQGAAPAGYPARTGAAPPQTYEAQSDSGSGEERSKRPATWITTTRP